MTKTQRVRLIAVLIFFSAISLPGSSYAQQIDSGTWIGLESYSTTVYNYNQMIIGETSGSNIWTTFNLEFLYSSPESPIEIGMSIGSLSIPFTFVDSNFQSYGPQYAIGSIQSDFYHLYYDSANFAVSYQAILPDGFIDTSGGYALVDMNVIDVNLYTGVTTNTFVSFQGGGLPEPSSLVLAASGILMVSIFAWMRGFTGR